MPKQGTAAKHPTSIRLTPEAKGLLAQMAAKGGISISAWMETFIRREAKRQRIEWGGGE